MVVRLAENGCLLNKLKKNRENACTNVKEKHVYFSHIDKTRIARDVASGMLHLSNKKVNKYSLKDKAQDKVNRMKCRRSTHAAYPGGSSFSCEQFVLTTQKATIIYTVRTENFKTE